MGDQFRPLFAQDDRTDAPTALYASRPNILKRLLIGVPPLVALAFFKGWWWLAFGGGVLLVVAAAGGIRRVDLDEDGLTVIPLVPLRPRRRYLFRHLGPFYVHTTEVRRRSPMMSVRSTIEPGSPYRVAGLWPQKTLTVGTGYGLSYGSEPLSLDELVEVLEERRLAALDRPVLRPL